MAAPGSIGVKLKKKISVLTETVKMEKKILPTLFS